MINSRRQAPVSTSTLPRLLDAMEDPNSTAKSIGDVVASDPGLASRTLGLANSAQFGLSRSVYKIDQAVGLVGTTTLRTLAIASASLLLEADNGLPKSQEHALRSGCAAKVIAKRCKIGWQDAFAAGLLHDLGEILLLQAAPTEYLSLRERWLGVEQQLVTETDLYGADHTTLGADHLDQWGLPQRLCDAIAGHHHFDADAAVLTLVVAAADEFVDEVAEPVALGLLGISPSDHGAIGRAVATECDDLRPVFAPA